MNVNKIPAMFLFKPNIMLYSDVNMYWLWFQKISQTFNINDKHTVYYKILLFIHTTKTFFSELYITVMVSSLFF